MRLEAMRYSGPKSTYVVQCVFPHNFISPAFLQEQESKPALTKYLEGTEGVSADALARRIPSANAVARELLVEASRDEFAVVERKWVPQLLWANMVGTSPRRGWGLIDTLLGFLAAWLIWPINRYDIEKHCSGHAVKK